MPRRVIIDCDVGLDDTQAIFMALQHQDVEVVAITTCHGNVDVDQVGKNVLRVLQVVDLHKEIPVYRGAKRSLTGRERVNSSHYHGRDGLGDVPDDSSPSLDLIKSEPAAVIIPKLARQYPGELTLMCLAPLTNIALALLLEPNLPSYLKDCYIMGGNYQGKGNITPTAEFNFYADPDAAAVVLSEMACSATVITWELCLRHKFSWSWYELFSSIPTKKGVFIKTTEKNAIKDFYNNSERSGSYCTADQLAVACWLLQDDIILERENVKAAVCTEGTLTLGQMAVLGTVSENDICLGGNICIVKKVDQDKFGELLMSALKN